VVTRESGSKVKLFNPRVHFVVWWKNRFENVDIFMKKAKSGGF